PTTNALQKTFGGSGSVAIGDGFLSVIDPTGTNLLRSTYLGGNGDDQVNGIAVDALGNVALVGMTDSINFPMESATQPVGNQGFFISTNGSWYASTSGLTNGSVTAMQIDPLNSSNIFLVAGKAVFKSTDAGGHWSSMNSGFGPVPLISIALDPVNAGTLYSGTFAGIYKSTNGAATWI